MGFEGEARDLGFNAGEIALQLDQAQVAVPPTVRPSMSKVGCPTPAGTD